MVSARRPVFLPLLRTGSGESAPEWRSRRAGGILRRKGETMDDGVKRPPVKRKPTKDDRKIEGLRTALIAIERVMGKSIATIAEKYSLSSTAVRRELSLAEESGLIDAYRALAYDRLVGPALAVYEARIAMGDLEAARDVLQGLAVLQKGSDAAKMKGKLAEETLASYRSARKTTGGAVRPTRPEVIVDVANDYRSH